MIRITDMTLSCLDSYNPSDEQLGTLLDLLLSTGVDVVEMPSWIYERIRPQPSNRFMLRISSPDEAAQYPEINRFICRKSCFVSNPEIISEIQINDVKEINFLSRYGTLRNVRIVGLDDVLCHDYESAFGNIKRMFRGRIEFCPENGFYCSTAAAVEWILNGGTDIVTAFGGITGKASLEEVILALRIVKRYKPGASFAMLPQLTALMEQIMSIRFSGRKAVIGRKIFDVESGIHIDGILKKPEMYEPFFPELVGIRRKFVVGKHSGKKAIRIKLSELGLNPEDYDAAELLGEVRDESTKKMSCLTDKEFLKIAQRHKK